MRPSSSAMRIPTPVDGSHNSTPVRSNPSPPPGRPIALVSAPRGARRGPYILLAATGVLCLINLLGFSYYRLPAPERFRHPWHAWLKPTGYIGQSMGIVALVLFLALWLYPLRKRSRWMRFTGRISSWLDVHVLMGLLIPLVGAVHAAWRFTGLIGLGYAAMLVAWFSGLLGKYLYARIPRSKTGLELTLEEVRGQRDSLLQEIAAASGFEPSQLERMLALSPSSCEGLGPLRTMIRMLSDDLARWRAARAFRRQWRFRSGSRDLDRRAVSRALSLARRHVALSQQVRMLDASQRVFQYWHVGHLPMAITALVAVDFGRWVKIAIQPEQKNLARWYAAVSARPSAKA